MKILVTGSKGNVGTELVAYLKNQGHSVYGIDIKQGFEENYSVVDINNPVDLLPVFELFRPHVVVHLAAMVSRVTCEKSPSLCIATNLGGTSNIIQFCKVFNSKLVFFSTSEVYGNIGGVLSEDRTDLQPNNIYGLSKLMGEQLVEYEVQNNKLRAVIIRPFMLYSSKETIGEHRSAMVRFAEGLLLRKKITVHIGSSRSWLFMQDAVRIIERLLYVRGFEIVNLANPEVFSTKELAEQMCTELGLNYSDYVIEEPLPDKMTLDKTPSVERMEKLLSGYTITYTNWRRAIVWLIEKITWDIKH